MSNENTINTTTIVDVGYDNVHKIFKVLNTSLNLFFDKYPELFEPELNKLKEIDIDLNNKNIFNNYCYVYGTALGLYWYTKKINFAENPFYLIKIDYDIDIGLFLANKIINDINKRKEYAKLISDKLIDIITKIAKSNNLDCIVLRNDYDQIFSIKFNSCDIYIDFYYLFLKNYKNMIVYNSGPGYFFPDDLKIIRQKIKYNGDVLEVNLLRDDINEKYFKLLYGEDFHHIQKNKPGKMS